jgi:hypothetical protein
VPPPARIELVNSGLERLNPPNVGLPPSGVAAITGVVGAYEVGFQLARVSTPPAAWNPPRKPSPCCSPVTSPPTHRPQSRRPQPRARQIERDRQARHRGPALKFNPATDHVVSKVN